MLSWGSPSIAPVWLIARCYQLLSVAHFGLLLFHLCHTTCVSNVPGKIITCTAMMN